jgi:histidinol-phosphate aminotransferase
VAEAARTLNRYPDREARALRTALAAYLTRTSGVWPAAERPVDPAAEHPVDGVSPAGQSGGQALDPGAERPVDTSQVWAANGSNEILQQLLQTFGGPGRLALGFDPSYSMHEIIARGTGTAWLTGPRRADFTIDLAAAVAAIAEHRPHVVFLCSPNNPTGTALSSDIVAALYDAAQRARPSLVIVDEAYVEFSHGGSLLPLLAGRPHLVITRTMSKAFGAAGLRLGYLAADARVVDAVQLVRLPYHLSSVTQAAALAALEHTDTLLGYVGRLKAERDRLVAELRTLGCEVTESDANFVQFGVFDDVKAAWQALLDHGVLVRDNGVPRRLRVTVGTPDENDAFIAALKTVLKEHT